MAYDPTTKIITRSYRFTTALDAEVGDVISQVQMDLVQDEITADVNTMVADVMVSVDALASDTIAASVASLGSYASTVTNVLATTAADRVQTGLDAASAATSKVDTALIYDTFDDRYLGAKLNDPALDNDGNALLTGAEYWNSTSGIRKTWDGSAWHGSLYNETAVTIIGGSIGGTAITLDQSLIPAPIAEGLMEWDTDGNQIAVGNGAATVVFSDDSKVSLLSANLSGLTNMSTARANIGLTIGTNVQAYDAALASISLLGSAADKLLYTTAINTFAETPFTLFARTLVGGANAGAMRTTLGVDAAGTDNSTNVTLAGTGTYLSLAGQAITVDPITESDIADLGTLATMNTDIGSTVQAHSATLDATTASFLTAHKAKLDFTTVTQAVNLDTMESRIAALSAAVVLKGTWDASVGTFPVSTTAGESWIVSVAGTVGGTAFVANDRIIATVNGASTTVYASNWHKLDYTDAVLSVAGRTGAVTLTVGDLVGFTDNSTNWNTAFTWGNHALAGYAANTNVTNWNTAFAWGNHASAGYLTTLALGGLSDATITTVAAGELLKWSGTGWINNTLVEAGIQASNARLSDISGITYAGGDLLYHNGTNLVKLPKGTAAQVLTMDGAGAVPTWAAASGGAPAGGYTTDISMLYLYTAENKGGRLNMVGGIMDPFTNQTDVDTVASTGEWYGINEYYRYGLGGANVVVPMTADVSSGQVTSASSINSAQYAAWVAFDGASTGNGWITIGNTPTGWLKIDLGYTSVTGGYKLYSSFVAGVTAAPKNWTFEGSADGATWTVLDTQTNITGWVGGTAKSFTLAASASYRYYRINVTLNNGNISFVGIGEFEIISAVTTTDMSLQSNAFTAASTPTTARLGVQTTGAITINTDVIGYASRDGGTTWSTATLVLVDTLADGTTYYEDGAVSLAAQPIGTSMKYKIVYTNSTAATLSGALLQWS